MKTLPALGTEDRRRIREFGEHFRELRDQVGRRIVGQDTVIEELLIVMLSEGHALIVGVPGLAKTLLVSTIAELLSLKFKRIQFTPDLMPSDITGATIIGADSLDGDRRLRFLRGPVFANILLADEINRTPPKTQAALMEAMEEGQVTAAGQRHKLERPFFVLATQNPIEQEGTYPLPVSQLDRFLFNIDIDYPDFDEEFEVLQLTTSTYITALKCLIEREGIIEALDLARRIDVPGTLLDYATLLNARDEVTDEDIHRVVFPALRHRVLLNYHGEAEGKKTDDVIEEVLLSMPGGRYRKDEPTQDVRTPWSFLKRWFGV